MIKSKEAVKDDNTSKEAEDALSQQTEREVVVWNRGAGMNYEKNELFFKNRLFSHLFQNIAGQQNVKVLFGNGVK